MELSGCRVGKEKREEKTIIRNTVWGEYLFSILKKYQSGKVTIKLLWVTNNKFIIYIWVHISVKYKGINYYKLDIKNYIPSYKMLYKSLLAINKR